jgi:hypothetical protein
MSEDSATDDDVVKTTLLQPLKDFSLSTGYIYPTNQSNLGTRLIYTKETFDFEFTGTTLVNLESISGINRRSDTTFIDSRLSSRNIDQHESTEIRIPLRSTLRLAGALILAFDVACVGGNATSNNLVLHPLLVAILAIGAATLVAMSFAHFGTSS